MVSAGLKCSHGPLVPPDLKVKYLFLAVAGKLARWDKGDCHTPAATKSLVPIAPDSKFVFVVEKL